MSHPALSPPWTKSPRRAAARTAAHDESPSGGSSIGRLFGGTFVLPFDLSRTMYDRAVQLGLVQRSLLANAFFENMLCATERATLGPWARRV